ncbi:MAG TPA: lysylphosphatidylglycerol synthase transmembrane domain-containing protein [Verrucomicrobiae bacterium]|nr:lysylphosphatidylglycerol synthase transmembrane domain-containing protein [Verrucomicrobiae bacterium]
MAETPFLRRRWKLIVNLITIAALIVLVVAIRGQLADTFRNLFKVHAWALLLIIPTEFLNYDAQARLYKSLFGIVGNDLGYWRMYAASLELNFINNVFPSGGVTGISYFGVRMRGSGITGAKAAVVQLLKLVLLFLSFEVLIVFGLFCLAIEGRINSVILLMAGMLTTVLVIGTAGFAYIIGSEKRIAGFFTWATRALNKLLAPFRHGRSDTINVERAQAMFEDLHVNYMLIRSDKRRLREPFLWAGLANLWEVVAVYVVYVAFGHLVNFGAVILAYAVANFAGLVSVLPGGVGIYEGLMTLVLTATGVPSRLSLPVTVMYRVVNTLVQLPPGYYFYHMTLHAAKKPTELDVV